VVLIFERDNYGKLSFLRFSINDLTDWPAASGGPFQINGMCVTIQHPISPASPS
jgi:hypothetical protein